MLSHQRDDDDDDDNNNNRFQVRGYNDPLLIFQIVCQLLSSYNDARMTAID